MFFYNINQTVCLPVGNPSSLISDSLVVSPGCSRHRLPFNCFVLRESGAHRTFMLSISFPIILLLICAVAEMAGSCDLPFPTLCDKQRFFTQTTSNPSIRLSDQIIDSFCGRTFQRVSGNDSGWISLLSLLESITFNFMIAFSNEYYKY